MNKLVIEEINVKCSEYRVKTQGYGQYFEHNTDHVKKLVIKHDEFQEFKKFLVDLKLSEFNENDKVYFHDSVTFSRNKFRELFPKTKIVYKIENATAIIIDKENLQGIYDKYYHRNQLYIGKDSLTETNFWVDSDASPFRKHPIEMEYFYTINDKSKNCLSTELIEMANLIISPITKLVDVNTIAISSDLVIDNNTFTSLNQLLKSGISSNMQLACSMLAGYDYGISGARMAVLLKLNWKNWINFRDKKSFIDLKTILKRIHSDFPYLHTDCNKTFTNQDIDKRFWFNLFAKYNEDEVIYAHFHSWFLTEMNYKGSNLEFVIRKKGSTDTFVLGNEVTKIDTEVPEIIIGNISGDKSPSYLNGVISQEQYDEAQRKREELYEQEMEVKELNAYLESQNVLES